MILVHTLSNEDNTHNSVQIKSKTSLFSLLLDKPPNLLQDRSKGSAMMTRHDYILIVASILHMCKKPSHNSINSMFWDMQFVRFSQKKWHNYDYRTSTFLLHAVDGGHYVMFPLKVFMINLWMQMYFTFRWIQFNRCHVYQILASCMLLLKPCECTNLFVCIYTTMILLYT